MSDALGRMSESTERRDERYDANRARTRADSYSSDALGATLTVLGIIVVGVAVAGGGLIAIGFIGGETPEFVVPAIGFALLGSIQGALVCAVGRMLEMLRSVSTANAATVTLLEGIAADTSRSAEYMHEAVRYQQGE